MSLGPGFRDNFELTTVSELLLVKEKKKAGSQTSGEMSADSKDSAVQQ